MCYEHLQYCTCNEAGVTSHIAVFYIQHTNMCDAFCGYSVPITFKFLSFILTGSKNFIDCRKLLASNISKKRLLAEFDKVNRTLKFVDLQNLFTRTKIMTKVLFTVLLFQLIQLIQSQHLMLILYTVSHASFFFKMANQQMSSKHIFNISLNTSIINSTMKFSAVL